MYHDSNAVIIVGGVVEQNGKYLLIQEAKAKCRGKWNLPAGHLEVGESLFEGALREIKEETGCDVELTGICQIGNRKRQDIAFISVIFTARLVTETPFITNPDEVLAVRWFSYEEILSMRDSIRNTDLMIGAIDNLRSGVVSPLEIVKIYQEGAEFQSTTIKGDSQG